jgi:hypothetical protein
MPIREVLMPTAAARSPIGSSPFALMADLESQQDAVLRRLDELNDRVERVLAQFAGQRGSGEPPGNGVAHHPGESYTPRSPRSAASCSRQ